MYYCVLNRNELKMSITKILGKSDGTSLIKHLIDVKNQVTISVNECVRENYLNDNKFFIKYLNNIVVAAITHDIGKATEFFQKKLKLNGDEFETNIKKIPFRHNEVSFAFLYTWTNLPVDGLKLVYWHHGINHTNKLTSNTVSDIMKSLTNTDIENMKRITKEIEKEIGYTILLDNPKKGFYSTPSFYSDINNYENDPEFLVALSCLRHADSFVSGMNISISDMIKKPIITDYSEPFSGPRYDLQKSIAQTNERMVFVNAPAGFGKTITGMLWCLKSDRKLIWVCPRNEIVDAVYKSIVEHLELLNLSISVEKFYSGEVKESNTDGCFFNSDIIVTNIDNYLKPSYENGLSYKNISILNADVIFDEYHELVGDAPLFSLFCHILNLRLNITDSNTMLLSATPIDFAHLWATEEQEKNITYLPGKNVHFNSAHNELFKYNFSENNSIKVIKDGTAYIINSISESQEIVNNLKHKKLIHSKFTEEDRKRNMNDVFELYGKNGSRLKTNPGYVGTHIIQASLDVSFKHLYEDVLSPMSSGQRGPGRCNRFGDNEELSEITLNRNSDKRNINVTNLIFNYSLANEWYYFLKSKIKGTITNNEFYVHYNDFMVEFKQQMDGYVEEKFQKSISGLREVYPKMFYNKTSVKSKNIKVGNNKLRSDSPEIFYICRDDQTNEIVGPFSTQIYDFSKIGSQFNEDANTLKEASNMIYEIIRSKNPKFDYSKLEQYKYGPTNGHTLDHLREMGKNSLTPYPAVNYKYNKTLGVYCEGKIIID